MKILPSIPLLVNKGYIKFRKRWILPRRWRLRREQKSVNAKISYEQLLAKIPELENEQAIAESNNELSSVKYLQAQLDLIKLIFNDSNS